MEYLQQAESDALLKASFSYGNLEAHLALLVIRATGTRVSQCLALKGTDVFADPQNGGYQIRILGKKRGQTVTYPVFPSPVEYRDMSAIVALAKVRGTNALFGGLTRHYLHVLIKKFAAIAGLHIDMVHAHTLRHGAAIEVFDGTGRIGAVSGYLGHRNPASAFPYLREADTRLAVEAMRAVFAAPAAA
jgi:integrase